MPYPAQEYAQLFQKHREALLDLLEQIPDEQGDTSAWQGGMTFKQMTDHLFSTGAGVVDMLSGGTWQRQAPSATLREAVARLRQNTQAVVQRFSTLSEDDLQGEVTAFGGAKWPAYQLIDFHREHEAHHKGQLWVMARQVGLEPPFFVRMG